MKGVQCYELFGGIALKNHAFSFFISFHPNLIDAGDQCFGHKSKRTLPKRPKKLIDINTKYIYSP